MQMLIQRHVAILNLREGPTGRFTISQVDQNIMLLGAPKRKNNDKTKTGRKKNITEVHNSASVFSFHAIY